LDIASSKKIDLKGKFEQHIGSDKHMGFNLFMAPPIEQLKKLNKEKRIKISFIFYIHNLISHAYYLIDDIYESEFLTEMELIIKHRIKYKKFYELKRFYDYMKMIISNKSSTLYKLT